MVYVVLSPANVRVTCRTDFVKVIATGIKLQDVISFGWAVVRKLNVVLYMPERRMAAEVALAQYEDSGSPERIIP